MVRVKKSARRRKYTINRRGEMDSAEIDRLARWFKTGAHSDLTIISGTERYRVHKFQLALRSKYFERLLYGNFAEKGKDEIELRDDDTAALQDVLKYMYIYKYEPSRYHANPILHHIRVALAADKYDMGDLAEEALEQFMEDAKTEATSDIQRFAEAAQMVYESEELTSYRPHIVKLANIGKYRAEPDKFKAIWDVIDTSTALAADLLRDPELVTKALKRSIEDDGTFPGKKAKTDGLSPFSDESD